MQDNKPKLFHRDTSTPIECPQLRCDGVVKLMTVRRLHRDEDGIVYATSTHRVHLCNKCRTFVPALQVYEMLADLEETESYHSARYECTEEKPIICKAGTISF